MTFDRYCPVVYAVALPLLPSPCIVGPSPTWDYTLCYPEIAVFSLVVLCVRYIYVGKVFCDTGFTPSAAIVI